MKIMKSINHRKGIAIVLRRRLQLQFNFLTLFNPWLMKKTKLKKKVLPKKVKVLYIVNYIYLFTFFKFFIYFCYFLINPFEYFLKSN